MIVIDDFLDNDYLIHIQDTIPYLKYELASSIDPEVLHFLNSVGEPFPNTDSLNTLAKKVVNLTCLRNPSIIRCYVNLNPQGEYHSGNFHTDDGDITALFYPFEWKSEWGGETEFEDGSKIENKMNRLVLFDAKKLHRAASHTSNNFRYTIALKLKAEWNEDSINN